MQKDDRVRLGHMRDAATKAVALLKGRSRTDLDEDELLALGVVRLLEIVGEAANQVSKETQSRFPAVAWREVVGMRNILIHGYFDLNLDIVWDTVTRNLPQLIRAVEAALDEMS
jgi:uncharacterized protein with HEPN domain